MKISSKLVVDDVDSENILLILCTELDKGNERTSETNASHASPSQIFYGVALYFLSRANWWHMGRNLQNHIFFLVSIVEVFVSFQ